MFAFVAATNVSFSFWIHFHEVHSLYNLGHDVNTTKGCQFFSEAFFVPRLTDSDGLFLNLVLKTVSFSTVGSSSSVSSTTGKLKFSVLLCE